MPIPQHVIDKLFANNESYKRVFEDLVVYLNNKYQKEFKAPDMWYVGLLLARMGWYGVSKQIPAQDDLDIIEAELKERAISHFREMKLELETGIII